MLGSLRVRAKVIAPHKVGATRLLTIFLIALIAGQTLPPAAAAADDIAYSGTIDTASPVIGDFATRYTALSKRILLASIELERFSLKRRLETGKVPPLRKYRYFLAQEAGAGCGLAFEVTGLDQFNKGRKRLVDFDPNAMRRALSTALTGSVIASSGSAFELSANMVRGYKNRRNGYDDKSANKYVAERLKTIDDLMGQRAKLVSEYSSDPAYNRAVAEGVVLQEMRNSFVREYALFTKDAAKFNAFQNSFFFLNSAYNAVGAVGAGLARKGLSNPDYNGPANITFIVSGTMAALTPIVSTGLGAWASRRSQHNLVKAIGPLPKEPTGSAYAEAQATLAQSTGPAPGSLIPSLPATQRLAFYEQSNSLFQKQLLNETSVMRTLNKVAVENIVLGPVIGSLLATQGIIGTYGSYELATRPKKQLNSFFHGAVCGTVGTSMAVVGNAASLLASIAYEHKLDKEHRLPKQLIDDRLKHLDDVEKVVSAL